jgi:hypothetical protein
MPLSEARTNIWKSVFASEKSFFSGCARRRLMPFGRKCLCETGFSNYAATKTKYRNIFKCGARF